MGSSVGTIIAIFADIVRRGIKTCNAYHDDGTSRYSRLYIMASHQRSIVHQSTNLTYINTWDIYRMLAVTVPSLMTTVLFLTDWVAYCVHSIFNIINFTRRKWRHLSLMYFCVFVVISGMNTWVHLRLHAPGYVLLRFINTLRPVRRRQFQMHLRDWKCLNFD